MIISKQEFFRKLKQVRKKTEEVNALTRELIDVDGIEDVYFGADNAFNLEEAIQCYIQYGEKPISGNIDDFWTPYRKLANKPFSGKILLCGDRSTSDI